MAETENLDEVLRLRMTKQLKAEIKRRAKSTNLKMSDFARMAIAKYMDAQDFRDQHMRDILAGKPTECDEQDMIEL